VIEFVDRPEVEKAEGNDTKNKGSKAA